MVTSVAPTENSIFSLLQCSSLLLGIFKMGIFFALSNFLRSFFRAIMKRTKPSVPWHFNCSVVTFKIPVMELMEKVTHVCTFFVCNIELFKTWVGKNWMNWLHIAMKHDMQRMARHDEMNQKIGIENQMFNRMHRNTWPGTNVNISVMHCMGDPI